MQVLNSDLFKDLSLSCSYLNQPLLSLWHYELAVIDYVGKKCYVVTHVLHVTAALSEAAGDLLCTFSEKTEQRKTEDALFIEKCFCLSTVQC